MESYASNCATIQKVRPEGRKLVEITISFDDGTRATKIAKNKDAVGLAVGQRVAVEPIELALIPATDCAPPLANQQSPFDGVWGGAMRSGTVEHDGELQFTVSGEDLVGYWQSPFRDEMMPMLGKVSGNKVAGRVQIKGGSKFFMELTDPNSITFKASGVKANLVRLNKTRPERHAGSQRLTGLGQVASAFLATQSKLASSPTQSARARSLDPTNTEAKSCGSYSIGSRGEHPVGYTCRCAFNGTQVGWWAIQPGNPAAGAIPCGPPMDANSSPAFTANDEVAAQAQKVAAWNAERMRLLETQATAQRELEARQSVEQKRHADFARQQTLEERRKQQQQKQQQQQQQFQSTNVPEVASGGSPDHCFSHRNETAGDVGTIVLVNRCSQRVYWHACVNRSTVPWNDYYPGSTPPGGTSRIRMWSPGEKTSAAFQYRTQFDTPPAQPQTC